MAQILQKHTQIIRYYGNVPLIRVERSPDWDNARVKRIRFWCEHCNCYHTHGAHVNRRFQGHRSAHCHVPNSPFNLIGYFMELDEVAKP